MTTPGATPRARWAPVGAFKMTARLTAGMPATKEIRCTSGSCELDMFETHYTYDIADDHSLSDLSCPLCGGTDCLEEIEL